MRLSQLTPSAILFAAVCGGAHAQFLSGIPLGTDTGVGIGSAGQTSSPANVGSGASGSTITFGGSIIGIPSIQPDSGGTDGATPISRVRTLQVTNASWSGTTNLLDLTKPRPASFPVRLSNVSVRGHVAPDSTLIGGAVITGAGTLPTFVRAVGPTLTQLNVTDALASPVLSVYAGNALAGTTNYAQTALAPVATYLGTFPSTVPNSNFTTPSDAALVGKASSGNITALCVGDNDNVGTALVEFYDASSTPAATSPRFLNFSGRARITSGNGVLIVGFVVVGDGQITLLLRGVGSSLGRFGITDTLPDPQIELYSGATKIGSSDNWQAEAKGSDVLAQTAGAIGAFPLNDPNEAALLVTLRAGNYSVQLRDASGRSGIGLAEVYEVSSAQ